jgi:DNA-directed RNA polymerase omega subunit
LTTQHELLDAAIKKVGNRYLATMLVAKRVRQLHHGAPAYVQHGDGESCFSVAMREIAEGLVVMQSSLADNVVTPAAPTASQEEAMPAETPPTGESPEETPVAQPDAS